MTAGTVARMVLAVWTVAVIPVLFVGWRLARWRRIDQLPPLPHSAVCPSCNAWSQIAAGDDICLDCEWEAADL